MNCSQCRLPALYIVTTGGKSDKPKRACGSHLSSVCRSKLSMLNSVTIVRVGGKKAEQMGLNDETDPSYA